MADLVSHIRQANHNEACANWILADKSEYRDWAITSAFYAAVHFAEACFTSRSDIGHTETAKDRGEYEEKHSYRKRKIREEASNAFRSYSKLLNASQNARYLTELSPSKPTAFQYYDVTTVRGFVEQELPLIRSELEKAFKVNLS